jgi:DNA-binding MarR family transcriptional regulator
VPALNAAKPSAETTRIEQGISAIVSWAVRNDVQQETMRRARCALPQGSIWLLTRMARCEPVRLSDLANALGVDNSTLTPQAQRLERAGLVAREPDPTDGRAALMRATRAGRALLARLQRTRRAMLEELLADWSERDRTQAAKVLARLAEQLDTTTVRAIR